MSSRSVHRHARRRAYSLAAYGYDAYRMISGALRQGHQTRQALGDALKAGTELTAVTSIGAFSSERVPIDPPRVYRIVGEVLEQLE